MIVIYTQDKTYIHKDAESAKEGLIRLYGTKLGKEAYSKVREGRVGFTYRKYGGPLVKCVGNEEARIIRQRERNIGMMD